jgi:polyketide biosynthesis enoyl-CoA hydratase PksI
VSDDRFVIAVDDDGVARVTIATDADPCMDAVWVDRLAETLDRVAERTDARVLVLEGGEACFCAGASLRSLTDAARAGERLGYAARAARVMSAAQLPVIAAVAGHAIGGGLIIALLCDIAILAVESLYAANFMTLGITPGMGATHVVERAFGEPLGRDLLLTGRTMTGREIRDACCPLTHAVLPKTAVREHALSLARRITDAPRDALLLLKRNLNAERTPALEHALANETDAHARLFGPRDRLEQLIERYPVAIEPAEGWGA